MTNEKWLPILQGKQESTASRTTLSVMFDFTGVINGLGRTVELCDQLMDVLLKDSSIHHGRVNELSSLFCKQSAVLLHTL
jgi:hypothetical protein